MNTIRFADFLNRHPEFESEVLGMCDRVKEISTFVFGEYVVEEHDDSPSKLRDLHEYYLASKGDLVISLGENAFFSIQPPCAGVHIFVDTMTFDDLLEVLEVVKESPIIIRYLGGGVERRLDLAIENLQKKKEEREEFDQ